MICHSRASPVILNVMFTLSHRPRCFSGVNVGFLASPAVRDFDWCKRGGKMDGDRLGLAVGAPGEATVLFHV